LASGVVPDEVLALGLTCLRQAGARASQWVEELHANLAFSLINARIAHATLEIEELAWWALSHFFTGLESGQRFAHADASANVSVPFKVHVARLLVADAESSPGIPVELLVAMLWHEFPIANINVELVELIVGAAVRTLADLLLNVPEL